VRRLIDDIRATIKGGDVGPEKIAQIESRVKEALPRLQASRVCTQTLSPGRYLCYKDPEYGFVIMVLVWASGDGTPIHDHGIWGVEAVLRHSLKVTNYSQNETDPQPLDTLIVAAGAIMHNLPPARDVHKVEHNSGDLAVSLHIYGREMTNNRSFVPGEGFKACRLECRELKLDLGLPAVTRHQDAGL